MPVDDPEWEAWNEGFDHMETALSRLSGLRLGTLMLPFLIGCGGTDADLTSTPAVAASPKAAVQETPSPTPPPATVEPSASPGPIVTPIAEFTMQASPWPTGYRPHDVAPALDVDVCYTTQGSGKLG